MKKLYLTLLISIMGILAMHAENVFELLNITKVECRLYDKTDRLKGRSAFYVPEIYLSDKYLYMKSDFSNYENVFIKIVDSQGFIVKNDIIQVFANEENPYYIGDLEKGEYEIILDFYDFYLLGEFKLP